MSLRTGFCCRNFLAQDKIKARRKLYLSLQFWDGALLPPAVLGWHLLTCNILPPDLRWHLLTSNILPPDVRWHLLTLKMFFTGRFAIDLLTCNILPPDVRWHLLTCNILPPDVRWHLLTCNILPPDVRWHLLTLKMFFTGRFAIAPSHLKKSFYRQSCNGIFSP